MLRIKNNKTRSRGENKIAAEHERVWSKRSISYQISKYFICLLGTVFRYKELFLLQP